MGDAGERDALWTEVVAPLLVAQDGVLTGTQLQDRAVPLTVVRRWVSSGRLVRLRRNVLVDGEIWRAAPAWDRHLLRARAVMLGAGHGLCREGRGGQGRDGTRAGATFALSHHSGLAVMRLSIHGTDDLAHVVGAGKSRRRGDLVRHAPVEEEHLTDAFGLPTVTPAVACVQVAGAFGIEAGLVAADSALRLKLCTREDLEALRGWRWLGRGRPAASVVIDRADRRHESAGESRSAWLLHRLGYAVRPQVVITDVDGTFIGRVDFQLEGEAVIIEFDGLLKYETQADLAAEKLREDRLRAMGYEVVRLVWADLADPEAVRAKIEAARQRLRARRRVG